MGIAITTMTMSVGMSMMMNREGQEEVAGRGRERPESQARTHMRRCQNMGRVERKLPGARSARRSSKAYGEI